MTYGTYFKSMPKLRQYKPVNNLLQYLEHERTPTNIKIILRLLDAVKWMSRDEVSQLYMLLEVSNRMQALNSAALSIRYIKHFGFLLRNTA